MEDAEQLSGCISAVAAPVAVTGTGVPNFASPYSPLAGVSSAAPDSFCLRAAAPVMPSSPVTSLVCSARPFSSYSSSSCTTVLREPCGEGCAPTAAKGGAEDEEKKTAASLFSAGEFQKEVTGFINSHAASLAALRAFVCAAAQLSLPPSADAPSLVSPDAQQKQQRQQQQQQQQLLKQQRQQQQQQGSLEPLGARITSVPFELDVLSLLNYSAAAGAALLQDPQQALQILEKEVLPSLCETLLRELQQQRREQRQQAQQSQRARGHQQQQTRHWQRQHQQQWQEQHQLENAEEAEEQVLLQAAPQLVVRLVHLPRDLQMEKAAASEIRSADVGELVCVTGRIIRAGLIHLLEEERTLSCRKCGFTFPVNASPALHYQLDIPSRCPSRRAARGSLNPSPATEDDDEEANEREGRGEGETYLSFERVTAASGNHSSTGSSSGRETSRWGSGSNSSRSISNRARTSGRRGWVRMGRKRWKNGKPFFFKQESAADGCDGDAFDFVGEPYRTDYQEIRLQCTGEETLATAAAASSRFAAARSLLSVVLLKDLAGKIAPGETATIVGFVRRRWPRLSMFSRCELETFVEANNCFSAPSTPDASLLLLSPAYSSLRLLASAALEQQRQLQQEAHEQQMQNLRPTLPQIFAAFWHCIRSSKSNRRGQSDRCSSSSTSYTSNDRRSPGSSNRSSGSRRSGSHGIRSSNGLSSQASSFSSSNESILESDEFEWDEWSARSRLIGAVCPSLHGLAAPKLAVLLTLISGCDPRATAAASPSEGASEGRSSTSLSSSESTVIDSADSFSTEREEEVHIQQQRHQINNNTRHTDRGRGAVHEEQQQAKEAGKISRWVKYQQPAAAATLQTWWPCSSNDSDVQHSGCSGSTNSSADSHVSSSRSSDCGRSDRTVSCWEDSEKHSGNSSTAGQHQRASGFVSEKGNAARAAPEENAEPAPTTGSSFPLACSFPSSSFSSSSFPCAEVAADDCMASRQLCHMLLVGSPGTGKSTLLKAAAALAPKSVAASGLGCSAAGLTCAAMRDAATGEWQLEAGALVLANNGVCCLDDFDLMKKDAQASIHEAMEQQSVSVAKVGLVTRLRARCSVVAALHSSKRSSSSSRSLFSLSNTCCNPFASSVSSSPLTRGREEHGGTYRKAARAAAAADEICCVDASLPLPLLSRFDTIAVLDDSATATEAAADLLLAEVTAPSLPASSPVLVSSSNSSGGGISSNSSSSVASFRSFAADFPWTLEMLRAYLSVVKCTFFPGLSPDAEQVLCRYYECLRSLLSSASSDLSPRPSPFVHLHTVLSASASWVRSSTVAAGAAAGGRLTPDVDLCGAAGASAARPRARDNHRSHKAGTQNQAGARDREEPEEAGGEASDGREREVELSKGLDFAAEGWSGSGGGGGACTLRFFESLIRLSQAHARLMWRTEVKRRDAVAVIWMLETCLAGYRVVPALRKNKDELPEGRQGLLFTLQPTRTMQVITELSAAARVRPQQRQHQQQQERHQHRAAAEGGMCPPPPQRFFRVSVEGAEMVDQATAALPSGNSGATAAGMTPAAAVHCDIRTAAEYETVEALVLRALGLQRKRRLPATAAFPNNREAGATAGGTQRMEDKQVLKWNKHVKSEGSCASLSTEKAQHMNNARQDTQSKHSPSPLRMSFETSEHVQGGVDAAAVPCGSARQPVCTSRSYNHMQREYPSRFESTKAARCCSAQYTRRDIWSGMYGYTTSPSSSTTSGGNNCRSANEGNNSSTHANSPCRGSYRNHSMGIGGSQWSSNTCSSGHGANSSKDGQADRAASKSESVNFKPSEAWKMPALSATLHRRIWNRP